MTPDVTGRAETQAAPALRALLTEIVDYAGLFPPARLPLDEALTDYARYRQGEDAWMLARFVLPVRRLEALTSHADLLMQRPPYRFSALGAGGDAPDAFLETLAADLEAIDAFHAAHEDRGLADVMEVRLPRALLDAETEAVQSFLGEVHRAVVRAGLGRLDLFFEVPLDADLDRRAPRLLAAMAEHNSHRALPLRAEVGFKMRCGGPAPKDHPSPERVAFAVDACRRAGVRFKATAGLHHPVRHYSEEAGAHMHGFLNLFAAAVLAHAHDLNAAAVHAILIDETPKHFRFDGNRLAWTDLEAPLDEIQDVRRTRAISFGSCSFDEPREDLRGLGLLL